MNQHIFSNLFRKYFLLYFTCCITTLSCSVEKRYSKKEDITIVPFPENIIYGSGHYSFEKKELSISIPESMSEMLTVFNQDYYLLFGSVIKKKKNGNLHMELDSKLPQQSYEIDISNNIHIRAGSQESLMMGWVSLLQLMHETDNKIRLPKCKIRDAPFLDYRGLLLDIAREYQSIESIKQLVDVCRWYKINYMQLHLSDDQLFTFPSDAFPKAPTKGKSYTKAALKELVTYARTRGVMIIPEFDAPGHTGALRAAYPKIFGSRELGMLDVANPAALEGCKTLIGEMIDLFHTSPYFHIGADEVWLGNFRNLKSTQKAVKDNNFDTPYDLYLDYIVEMHKYVKSKGKQTLMWESFENNGSEKVKIPNDILVFAWETMYQRPDDLIGNGYTLLNASWKPCYITPQTRWTQSQIYHWNIWRWEHFLDFAPAWNPIQFEGETKDKVIGAQLCAWEMTEEMNTPSILPRLPALSENAWNPSLPKDYSFFSKRFNIADQKLARLLFPAEIKKDGLTTGIADQRFYNRENYFTGKLNIYVESHLPDISIRYTTDGSIPDTNSQPLLNPISIDSTCLLKVALYQNHKLIGYKSELLEKRPVELIFTGSKNDPDSPIDGTESFTDSIRISFNLLNPEYMVKYTLDGSAPTNKSAAGNQELVISENTTLNVQCFDKNGNKQGSAYTYKLKRINTGRP